MPMTREVKRLGGRWSEVVDRVATYSKSIPEVGLSLAAFRENALADVNPRDVSGIVKALEGKGVVWVRRNRGEARVYAKRPSETIAGLVGGSDAGELCLAACVPHLCSVTRALGERERAKAEGDFLGAAEARDRISASCGRLVALVRRHLARGLSLAAFKEILWTNWAAGTLEAVAVYEPALARGSEASLPHVESTLRKRIPAGLASYEKVAALAGKAGAKGVTRTGLLQGIRPKPKAAELSSILEGLMAMGKVEPREVRVAGSARVGIRFFAVAA